MMPSQDEFAAPNSSGDFVTTLTESEVAGLVRLAYVLSGEKEMAQDLVQTVLLKLWQRGMDGIDEPVAYAKRAVLNGYITEGRKATRARRLRQTLARQESGGEFDNAVVDREDVRSALCVLRPRQRAVIILRYWDDLTDTQIAEALGCKEATVRSLLSRARSRMRPYLQESSQ